MLRLDPNSRVAVETLTTTGLVVVAGEVTTKCHVDIQKIAREVIKDIGYDKPEYGFDFDSCSVLVSLHAQSPNIAMGVDETKDKEQGAGDQGLMFGYACNETPELMPLPIATAHKLTMKLAELRKNGAIKWLRPDGKSQVTVRYEDGAPKEIVKIVVAAQHSPNVEYKEIRETIINQVINPVCGDMLSKDVEYFINPTGKFIIGGPPGDSGVTGRKIIVDTYGGMGRHGGGAFSGKDPSKVDRSAAYMARHIAKNVVAAGLADKCEVQISYAIGVAEPVSVMVNTFDTAKVSEENIEDAVKRTFSLKPKEIIDYLDLLRPIYRKTAAYGHFGRNDPDFTWEKTNKVEELRKACGL